MKRLPIAKAVFKKLIQGDFCYVDKTNYIKELNDSGEKYWFLSRPRRFGKSLFLDTIRAAFAGEKELFTGLFLEKNWDWDTKYPVIKISLGSSNAATAEETRIILNEKLNAVAKQFNVNIESTSVSGKFEELISTLYHKFKQEVVVLIDEYDKPMLDNITDDTVFEIRKELAGFYSPLKDSEEYLKFVFITGVSKFSRTSIFSKLNNLQDISMRPEYGNICGYTQNDLETVFADYLQNVDLKELKKWYDGYRFLADDLYNPYSILLFLRTKEFKAYWFETGTPTFLMQLIRQKRFHLLKLENISLSEEQLGEFDLDKIDLVALLFQTGYLSIKNVTRLGVHALYNLQFPNREVRFAFNSFLVRTLYTNSADSTERSELYQQIYYAITNNKPEDLEAAFFTFFSGIPFDWYRKNNISKFEGFYSSMFYAFFAALGFDIIPEDFTNKGRIDLTIKTKTGIFIFEFKMKTNTQNALLQIKNKKYHEKYSNFKRDIFLIGIEFDEEKQNISLFESEKLK